MKEVLQLLNKNMDIWGPSKTTDYERWNITKPKKSVQLIANN